MKSPRLDSHLVRRLTLTAALLVQFGAAAAQPAGDAQAQARALLAPATTHAAPHTPLFTRAVADPTADPQAHARRLLSGASTTAAASRQLRVASAAGRAHPDVQALAQRLITGNRDGERLD